VGELGVVIERLEPVREALRNEQRVAVALAQLDTEPLAVGRRGRADVDDHVIDSPADTADELGLAVRRALIVQSAQRAGLPIVGLAGLHKIDVADLACERVAAPGAHEIAAFVFVALWRDKPHARELELMEVHCALQNSWESSCPSRSRYWSCLSRVKARKLKTSLLMSIFLKSEKSWTAPIVALRLQVK